MPPSVFCNADSVAGIVVDLCALQCLQDVIHTISSPYGMVQRVAIFRKNGVQALVEFDSNASALRAKANLDGADIYAGCCTLKIEFARVSIGLAMQQEWRTWFGVQWTVKWGFSFMHADAASQCVQERRHDVRLHHAG